MNFTIGLSVGIIVMMAITGHIIHRANRTLRTLHHECGMAAEKTKYSDYVASERLQSAMSYAESRHSGLKFVEQYVMHVDDH